MYSTKIYQSLTRPVLLAGVPRNLMIVNFMVSSELFFVFHAWWIVIFAAFIHATAVAFAQVEPDFVDLFIRHVKHNDYYDT